ncbi:hypothetical protein BY996DRAFT_6428792 [Phakopsora pachyrhizi]|nr:hypothetical protein BY996DRAFT_6428792 [Phakopsora pachyrhizi]
MSSNHEVPICLAGVTYRKKPGTLEAFQQPPEMEPGIEGAKPDSGLCLHQRRGGAKVMIKIVASSKNFPSTENSKATGKDPQKTDENFLFTFINQVDAPKDWYRFKDEISSIIANNRSKIQDQDVLMFSQFTAHLLAISSQTLPPQDSFKLAVPSAAMVKILGYENGKPREDQIKLCVELASQLKGTSSRCTAKGDVREGGRWHTSTSEYLTVDNLSAHRTPDRMTEFAKLAASRGIKVIIAGAGGAAHLPGMVSALTPLLVIGVPVIGKVLDGIDSLHSIVQMPRGIPVATVAIGNQHQIKQA